MEKGKTMSDLISRQDVKDLILEIDPFWAEGTTRAILDGVNEIRAASCVETIVRCKDCKHMGGFGCPWWKGEIIPPEWYCANGERKDDAV